MVVFTAIILIALGIIPSLLWLAFYLRKDSHPEPGYLLTKVFLMGIIISPLAIIFEYAFSSLANYSSWPIFAAGSAAYYLWVAFVEEFVKFYAVRIVALNSPEFDEPVDAMIYMMTAGLGFAAIENILYLFRATPLTGLSSAHAIEVLAAIWTARSLGAVLLHALSSGIVGYFLAMAWFFRDQHKKLLFIGLALATMFHFTFDILLTTASSLVVILYVVGLLCIMGFLVSILFDKIKKRHAKNLVPMIVESSQN